MPFLLYTHCFLCDWVRFIIFRWYTQYFLFGWVFLHILILYTQYPLDDWVLIFNYYFVYTQHNRFTPDSPCYLGEFTYLNLITYLF